MARIVINTSMSMNFSDDGDLVYFDVNVLQLFNVKLNYPGMINSLNKAFRHSRKFTPIDTGLMRKSYTMERTSDNTVKLFFDPNKIIRQNRKGRKVKDYYPKYLKEKAKTVNWLDLVMKAFFSELIKEVRKIKRKQDAKSALKLTAALTFMALYQKELDKKIEAEEERNKRRQGGRNEKS